MATPDRQTIDPTNAYEEQLKILQSNMQQDQRQGTLFNLRQSESTAKWNDFVFGMYVNEQGRRQSFMTLADNVLAVQALGAAGVSNATLSSLTAEIAELKAKMNDVNEIVVEALRTGTPPVAYPATSAERLPGMRAGAMTLARCLARLNRSKTCCRRMNLRRCAAPKHLPKRVRA